MMQVVSYLCAPATIAVQKLQIQNGVACDPIEAKWSTALNDIDVYFIAEAVSLHSLSLSLSLLSVDMRVADSGHRAGSDGGSPTASRKYIGSRGSREASHTTSSSSFFIIQEPVISPSGGSVDANNARTEQLRRSPTSFRPKLKSTKNRNASPLSPDSHGDAPRVRTKQRAAASDVDTPVTALNTHEESLLEKDGAAANASTLEQRDARIWEKRTAPLSILNRVGSAPDLPLHSSVSSTVYSSSKKRNLLKTVGLRGAGPHAVALQRSRLIPLPINIRTGTLTREARDSRWSSSSSNNNIDTAADARESRLTTVPSADNAHQQLVEEEAANADYAIAALKQRLTQMEKEATRDLKQRQTLERQTAQLVRENKRLCAEKQELQSKLEHVEKDVLLQKHAFEKLSDRYAGAYNNLQKLTEQQQSTGSDKHSGAVQTVLQALTRENQEFRRKLRVLEARHADDKALTERQEKKLKRLRAELEALQHMHEANSRDGAASEVQSEYSHRPSLEAKQAHTTLTNSTAEASRRASLSGAASAVGSSSKSAPTKATSALTVTPATGSASSANGSSGHLIRADDYQYIDPNILKVLEKVDSQFSITNAITLSAVLKKWLNSCLRVVSSTHIPSVLKLLLTRICELLHCEHAAIFEVDHTGRRLIGKYTESGDVHWELPLDKGIIGFSARQNTLCNVPRAYDDPRFYSSTDTITGIPSRELLCIPIVHELQPGQPRCVFAVLQAWNTTHQKPFTPNDQILGGLLTIQAGTVFLQTQKINAKLVRIMRMPQEIVPEDVAMAPQDDFASTLVEGHASPLPTTATMSLLQLVANAQKQFSECIGIKKLRIFVLEAEVMRVWHVGSELDTDSGRAVLVRKYSNVLSSLCGMAVKTASNASVVLEDPTSEAMFNDIVDLNGGAGGLYLSPISSPLGSLPLGMIQVARSSVTAVVGDDPGFAAAVAKEKQAAQASEDMLTLELIETFARVFAGLLHHVKAQQLYDTCPKEIRDARLAYLTDRLDCLENECREEQEQNEAKEEQVTRALAATAMMEQRFLESAQRERSRGGQRPEQPVVAEKEPTRRVSFSEEVLHPGASVHKRDSRRVSSAGSTRKSASVALYSPALGIVHVGGTDEAQAGAREKADENEAEQLSEDDGDDAGEKAEERDFHHATELGSSDATQLDDLSSDSSRASDHIAVDAEAERALQDEDDRDTTTGDSGDPDTSESHLNDFAPADWRYEQYRDSDFTEDGGAFDGLQEHDDGQQAEEYEGYSEPDEPQSGGGDDTFAGGSWRQDDAPVGLISTDSMYGIDLSYSDHSPPELATGDTNDSFSPIGEDQDPQLGASFPSAASRSARSVRSSSSMKRNQNGTVTSATSTSGQLMQSRSRPTTAAWPISRSPTS
ncbi:hypothetical protein PybrP1_008973, partial [[Pythium] brassicae (nom. inval.)]